MRVGRDCCTAGQHQWLAFQMHTLAADEMRVSGHLGSLPNSGEQHVPPGAFCIFPSQSCFFQAPENKQPLPYLLCSLPMLVKSGSLPPLAFTNCIPHRVTPYPTSVPLPLVVTLLDLPSHIFSLLLFPLLPCLIFCPTAAPRPRILVDLILLSILIRILS